MLDLKPHVVRYWEQSVEMLSPTKSRAGRRVYTTADVQLLSRVKHLVQDLHYTVPGAAQRLLDECAGPRPDARARIHEIRHELLASLGRLRRHQSADESADNLGDEA